MLNQKKKIAVPVLQVMISEVRYKMMQRMTLYKISTPISLSPQISWSQNPLVKAYQDPSLQPVHILGPVAKKINQ